MQRVSIGGLILSYGVGLLSMRAGPDRLSLLWKRSLSGCALTGFVASGYFLITLGYSYDPTSEDSLFLHAKLLWLWEQIHVKQDVTYDAAVRDRAQQAINKYKHFHSNILWLTSFTSWPPNENGDPYPLVWKKAQVIAALNTFPNNQDVRILIRQKSEVDDEEFQSLVKQLTDLELTICKKPDLLHQVFESEVSSWETLRARKDFSRIGSFVLRRAC